MVELTSDHLKCMSLFEQMTSAIALDCLIDPNAFVFVVKQGDLGKAIGKKGASINRARTAFGKSVFVVEDADSIEQFIKNMFSNVQVTGINVHEKMNARVAYVTVDEKDRGASIGKSGERIKLNRSLLMRRYGCDLRIVSKQEMPSSQDGRLAREGKEMPDKIGTPAQ
ncbi:MAG TPA: NusA-like transcription termination signal-binding factor [Candidatus Micrarchaeota archaeon]|nr:NusA-like transcription termination signal-binding factor [Candidatus Micrarchaeota archaeon]